MNERLSRFFHAICRISRRRPTVRTRLLHLRLLWSLCADVGNTGTVHHDRSGEVRSMNLEELWTIVQIKITQVIEFLVKY